jgi:hypothetical protein
MKTITLFVISFILAGAGCCGQLRNYVGVPNPVDANPTLTASSASTTTGGFAPWPGWNPYDVATPQHPPSWPSVEAPGYYYVNPDDPDATNTDNTYGTPDRPRSSLPSDGTYPAGTYIELHGTFPDLSADKYWKFQGTPENPCWITGDCTFQTALFRIGGSSHLIVEGIRFGRVNLSSDTSHKVMDFGDVLEDTHHILVRNVTVENRRAVSGARGSVFSIGGNKGATNSYIVFDNVRIDGVGATDGVPDFDWTLYNPDTHGISWAGTSNLHFVWITNCYFSGIAGNGVQANISSGNGTTATAAFHWIAGCVAEGNQQAGFWSKKGNDTIFSSNTSRAITGSYAGGNNNGMGCQYGPDWFWVINNKIYNAAQGSKRSASDSPAPTTDSASPKHFWIGNVIYDIRSSGTTSLYKKGGGVELWKGYSFSFILCNTFHSVEAGIRSVGNVTGDLWAAGNLVHTVNDPSDTLNPGRFIDIDQYAVANKGHLHHNLGYQPNATGAEQFWDFPKKNTVAALNTRARAGNNLEGDPLFLNPSVNPIVADFRLNAGSPAIDRWDGKVTTDGLVYDAGAYSLPFDVGGVMDVFQAYEDRYGLSIAIDINGVTRPQGVSWDIGAFEYTLSGPSSPKNSKIVTDVP